MVPSREEGRRLVQGNIHIEWLFSLKEYMANATFTQLQALTPLGLQLALLHEFEYMENSTFNGSSIFALFDVVSFLNPVTYVILTTTTTTSTTSTTSTSTSATTTTSTTALWDNWVGDVTIQFVMEMALWPASSARQVVADKKAFNALRRVGMRLAGYPAVEGAVPTHAPGQSPCPHTACALLACPHCGPNVDPGSVVSAGLLGPEIPFRLDATRGVRRAP